MQDRACTVCADQALSAASEGHRNDRQPHTVGGLAIDTGIRRSSIAAGDGTVGSVMSRRAKALARYAPTRFLPQDHSGVAQQGPASDTEQ